MNSSIVKPNRNAIVFEDLRCIVHNYSIPWEKLRNKTILVSGASGFLAAYMVETLMFLNETHQLNAMVIAIVRNQNGFKQRFHHLDSRSDLKCLEHDISTPLKIEQRIDFIIHAASQASPKYYSVDPVGTLSANTLGTAQLLDLAKHYNVDGFLYFSSAEVYGEPSCVPTKESDYGYLDPLLVRSCYSESKRMGENMCVSWHHQYGVNTKIVRPFHTYGPGMKLDDGRIYADLVADVINGCDIVLKSDGLARRSFCYLADATAAFWIVLLNGKNAQAYNVGNPEGEISIRDLAFLVAGIKPEKKIEVKFEQRKEFDKYLPSQVSVTCPDIALIKELSWHPVTQLKDGFTKTIASYQS